MCAEPFSSTPKNCEPLITPALLRSNSRLKKERNSCSVASVASWSGLQVENDCTDTSGRSATSWPSSASSGASPITRRSCISSISSLQSTACLKAASDERASGGSRSGTMLGSRLAKKAFRDFFERSALPASPSFQNDKSSASNSCLEQSLARSISADAVTSTLQVPPSRQVAARRRSSESVSVMRIPQFASCLG
ncbi:hypothetical protein CSUI_002490 [Cystoisospora suis]|uniref:Uncharacterized protein n=1 Tax=Cystoisospora suis TaxID=483139 RepID=A0A2C6L941_9APIC|nr:hypothetical protein CSUI_002490 [Cystoisospora suis]